MPKTTSGSTQRTLRAVFMKNTVVFKSKKKVEPMLKKKIGAKKYFCTSTPKQKKTKDGLSKRCA
jgi:hypothetical protein